MFYLICYILFVYYYTLLKIVLLTLAMFHHNRKSFMGVSLPFWVKPRPIYIKNYNRNNESDLLVEEAALLEANLQYAYMRLKDGREISVSL